MFGNSARHPRALEFAEVDATWAVAEGLSDVRSAAAGGRHQRHARHPALDAKMEMTTCCTANEGPGENPI